MLSRIVLWANRLKDWNTIPTSARRSASALPSSGSFWPSMVIEPDSIGFQPVDRPAERGLARPGRADQNHHFALVDREVDVLEDVQVAEVLVDCFDQDDERFSDFLGCDRLAGGGVGEVDVLTVGHGPTIDDCARDRWEASVEIRLRDLDDRARNALVTTNSPATAELITGSRE